MMAPVQQAPWRACRSAVQALVAALALGPVAGGAQDVGAMPPGTPPWTRTGSPLLWTADLPRVLPDALGGLPDPLLWSLPRIGLFWTAGNPAALTVDVSDRIAVFQSTTGMRDGGYRRPLDPASESARGIQAMGWRTFDGNAAAVGSVRVDRLELRGARSDFDLPYPGSPYVVMDTAASQLGRIEAVLEGAAGWRRGPWSVGVALGYRAQQSRTAAAPVPRVLSAVDPGAGLGLTWSQSPSFQLGAHGRWRAHAERVLLYSVAAASRVYRLQGYFEPRPQDIAGGYYQRRMERDGAAGSVEMGGRHGLIAWVAFAERGTLDERQHPPGDNNPASDTWSADAWTFGGAVRLGGDGSRRNVTTSVRYTSLSGAATRGDLPDTVPFVADESVLDAWSQATLRVNEPVTLAALVTLRREDRRRTDHLARIGSDLRGWTSGIGVGLGVQATERLRLGVAGNLTRYGGSGSIPDPMLMGPIFRANVAPELSLAASDASASAVSLSLLWRGPFAGSLWGRLRCATLKGMDDGVMISGLPRGSRDAWSLELGIVMGGDAGR